MMTERERERGFVLDLGDVGVDEEVGTEGGAWRVGGSGIAKRTVGELGRGEVGFEEIRVIELERKWG